MKNTLSYSQSTYCFSLLKGGIPKTGLIGIQGTLGSGKTEAVIQFLNENDKLKAVWVESEFNLYPQALGLQGVSLERILFLESSWVFWCVTQVLKSQIFQVAILYHDAFSEVELRRLQILARQTQSLILLLQDTEKILSQVRWPFLLQLESRRTQVSSHPILNILRSKNSELWHAQM
jgi:hypothetical protein